MQSFCFFFFSLLFFYLPFTFDTLMPPKEKPTTSAQLETQEDDKSKKPVVGKRQKIVKACKDCRRRKVRNSTCLVR
jgi:hypothetical protein